MSGGTEAGTGTIEPRRLERITQRRWAWIGVVVWVALLGIASPLAQKLSNVEDNQAVNYLPGNAQSTKAFQALQAFPSASNATAIAVWVSRSGPLTNADLATVSAARSAIQSRVNISGPASPVAISKDGKAAAVEVNLPAPQTPKGTSTQHSIDVLDHAYDRLKAQVNATSTLQVGVAGPAAIAVESNTAFKGIDGILILAAGLVVAILLLLIYRSPILWLIPLLTSGLALELAQGVVYVLARHAGLTVTGLSAGILNVLVFGAGTDYALLLIARYREELHYHDKSHIALAIALRRAAPAMIASASTVILGLLCLLAATLNSDRGLGPVAAVGVACAILAAITLLPAMLAVCGRRIFWPFIPRVQTTSPQGDLWTRVADKVEQRHRPAWIGLVLVLGACTVALSAIQLGLPNNDSFTNNPPPIRAQHLLDAHFPSGTGNPADIVTTTAAVSRVEQVAKATSGVASVSVVEQHGDKTHLQALLSDAPDSSGADHTIVMLRQRLGRVAGAGALVGGQTAIDFDTNNAASHDRDVVIPLILIVVALILALLLRAILAPIVLILTVMLSFGAALGVSAVVFRYVFHFAGVDQTVPLYAFLFLVALGVDYNIFLMTRIREESISGPTMEAIHTGLARTGGVITSAGLILAATFAVLGVLPLVVLAEVGFTVAFGILLDTFLVRSVLVPALCWEIGAPIWWPSKLRLTSR
jgi:RND superfamily putative drug exporter